MATLTKFTLAFQSLFLCFVLYLMKAGPKEGMEHYSWIATYLTFGIAVGGLLLYKRAGIERKTFTSLASVYLTIALSPSIAFAFFLFWTLKQYQ